VAGKRGLAAYEVPRDFIVACEPFSKANHLLTDSGKPAAGRLRATCAPRAGAAPGLSACGTCPSSPALRGGAPQG